MSELSDYEAVEYLEGLREDLKNDVIDEDLQALDKAIKRLKIEIKTEGTNMIKRFIDECENDIDYEAIKYNAGKVSCDNGRYYVSFEQVGARKMFSIGQPVYDYENNIMGYLGIVPIDNLHYSRSYTGEIKIPVEQWEICLPTEHCKKGKQIFTYWQILEDQENE